MIKHILGIMPYNKYSKSSKLLRNILGLLRYKEQDYYYCLVNWGSSKDNSNYQHILNKPTNIINSNNKLLSYKLFKDNNIRTVNYTTSKQEVLDKFNLPVLCRKNYSYGGKGINIITSKDYIPSADFYTEYIDKEAEYRAHVFLDEVISWSKKIPKTEDNKSLICNHEYGFKFSKRFDSCPPILSEMAIKSVKALGLDFGAVDIIKGKDGKYYVLEVNTAIGIDNSTALIYAEKIRKWIKNADNR